ncbi:MAG: glutathione S-transferase family protein [Pseudomonadota bacterium]
MNTHTTPGKTDTGPLAKAARLGAVGDAARRTIVSPDHPTPDRPRAEEAPAPRLELFHFVMSICSQKSRAALFEAGQGFASNELVIMPPLAENYHPDYVALRLASPLAASATMVSSYSGATGTEGEGFDPLVVPTLVDHELGAVIADSRLIALHADTLSGGRLIPDAHRAIVMAEVERVDGLPMAGLFYGPNPDGDHRPAPIQAGMKDAHLRKIEQIRARRDALEDDSPLRLAYEHKLLKEEAGRQFVHDPASMKGIIADTAGAIAALDAVLNARPGDWIAGDDFTLADVFWGVSLFRLLYLGYGWMWADRPAVAGFADAAFARPSIRAGAIDWPGHPPGETIAHLV